MEEKKSKKKVLIIGLLILLLIIIAGLGITVYMLLHKPEEPKPERTVSEGLVVDDNIDQKASEARFTTDMNVILKCIWMMTSRHCSTVLRFFQWERDWRNWN